MAARQGDGLHEGTRLVVVYDREADEARVRAVRDSHAGALRDVYGESSAEIGEYAEGERESWS